MSGFEQVTDINPFGLLGVTIHSSPQEARHAYYNLALLFHPDKGGNASDMRVLHRAYRDVVRQLEGVGQRTFEELEKEHEFPSMSEFPEERLKQDMFSRLWEEQAPANIWTSSWSKGYGDEMVPSDRTTVEYNSVETGVPAVQYSTQIQLYTPPEPWTSLSLAPAPLEPSDDMTSYQANVCMADYHDAFQPKQIETVVPTLSYEEYLLQRSFDTFNLE